MSAVFVIIRTLAVVLLLLFFHCPVPLAAGTEQTTAQSLDVIPPSRSSSEGQAVKENEAVAWLELEKGLDYAELVTPGFSLVAVRINPEYFDFVLCSAGRDKEGARTLREWSEKYKLSVVINASMYLPDGLTSTGYMRSGDYINNKRIVQRFGAFFAAQPDDPDLPRATILERDTDIWRELLSHYSVVIQNYRIISSGRRILWSPGGPLYSISAVATDGTGNILFLHSREPVEAYSFAQHLLHLPLDIRTVMYVEGGGQAGLLVRSQKLEREHQGRNAVDFLVSGNRTVLLPNVIGAKPIARENTRDNLNGLSRFQ